MPYDFNLGCFDQLQFLLLITNHTEWTRLAVLAKVLAIQCPFGWYPVAGQIAV